MSSKPTDELPAPAEVAADVSVKPARKSPRPPPPRGAQTIPVRKPQPHAAHAAPIAVAKFEDEAPTKDMAKQLPPLPVRKLSDRPETETTRRDSVRPAIVMPDRSAGSAPKAAPVPREFVEEPPELDADLLSVAIESTPPPPMDVSSNPPPELPVVGKFGNYEVHGRLAFGGMAEIFLARENDNGAIRSVVIKRILPHVADDDQFVQMFLDEARLAIRLSHPSICHIYEFGRQEGSYFIAMEYVWGTTLGRIGRRAHQIGKIWIPGMVKIAATVAESLHYAHRARDERGRALGIVHRDVSPHNVMVSFDGVIKLLDFGVAKAAIHGTKTQAGVVKGKFAYMSPQQCTGQEVDGRADVFSLGICLYECLTGKLLYHRPTEYETMKAVLDDPVPSLRAVDETLPEALDKIVQKALAKSPIDRYRTAGELQAALEQWLADEGEPVNSERLSDWLDDLFHEDIKKGPQVDTGAASGLSRVQRRGIQDVVAPELADDVGRPSVEIIIEGATPQKRATRPPAWLVGVGALALVACAVGAWLAFRGDGADASTTTARGGANGNASGVATNGTNGNTTGAGTNGNTAAGTGAGATEGTQTGGTTVAPAASGTMHVVSVPSGANIRLRGRRLEVTTPTDLADLPPGTHEIVLIREGFHSWTQQVEIRAGETANVTANLRAREPTAPPGYLSVNTRPWSKVYVGSRMLGTTPIGRAEVPSGTVRLRLVDRDGQTHSHTIRIAPGQHERISLDFGSR